MYFWSLIYIDTQILFQWLVHETVVDYITCQEGYQIYTSIDNIDPTTGEIYHAYCFDKDIIPYVCRGNFPQLFFYRGFGYIHMFVVHVVQGGEY